MKHYFAPVSIVLALAFALPAAAQDGPLDPLRKVFAPAAKTLKQTFEGSRPAARAATAPAAPDTPDEAAAPPADTLGTAAGQAPDGNETPPNALADVPTPHVRPDGADPADPSADDQPVEIANTEPASFDERFEPEPPPAAGIPAADIPLPRLRSDAPPPPPSGATRLASLPAGDGLATGSACRRSLAALGVVSVSVAPVRKGTCGIQAPTEISALGGGAISLTEKALVDCQLAETLATFMRDSANPAARQFLGGNVTGIRVAASYSCRTRDNIPGAKMSEHAYGNAIDISAFQVAGTGWVEVGRSRGIAASRFLAAVRKSACGPFTTVLGPGSDRYHSEHFHFDLARRGKSGRSLYCK